MQIIYTSPKVARMEDRSPSKLFVNFRSAPLPPHSWVLRDEYAIPVNFKAFIEGIRFYAKRTAIAGESKEIILEATLDNGGTVLQIALKKGTAYLIGDEIVFYLPIRILATTADVLRLYTLDSSNGGEVEYNMEIFGTLFSA